MQFEVENVNRCLTSGVVLVFRGRKILLLDAFQTKRFVSISSATLCIYHLRLILADKLVRQPTVDQNYIKHHKTLAYSTF